MIKYIYIILKGKQNQGTIMDIIIKIIGRYINHVLPKNDFKSIFDVIMKNTHQKSKRNLENTFEKNIFRIFDGQFCFNT